MIDNIYIEKNFRLLEFINAKMPARAIVMNDNAFEKMNESEKEKLLINIKKIAKILQEIRDKYNAPIIISSGWRLKEWELERGRSGESQHVYGHAVDFIVAGEKSQEIMEQIMVDYRKYMGGLAIKKRNGKIIFIHLDCREPEQMHIDRGFGARWTY